MAINNLGQTNLVTPATNQYTNPTIANTVNRPYLLDNMDVDTALTRDSWEDTLRVLATTGDVFEKGMANVNEIGERGISLPDAIGIKLTVGGQNVTHTIPVLDAITGSPRAGNEALLGYERSVGRLRYMTAIYTEMKDAVMVEQYGLNFNQLDVFGFYQQATPQLTKYWAEVKGRAKREALTEWYNIELTKANAFNASGVTRSINPNTFVVGEKTGASTATWSPVLQTFANNVGALLDNATTNGTTNSDSYVSLAALDRMIFNAEDLRMEPLDDGTFVLVLPMPQWYKLSGTGTGQFGNLWTSVTQYADNVMKYPGEVGMYRNLRIVKDDRYATCVVTKVSTNYSYAFKYQQPGGKDGDERDKGTYTYNGTTGNRTYQIGWFLGKGAYIERVEKDLYFKEETQDYERYKGIGTFMEYGCNLAVIRTDTADGTTKLPTYVENRSSAVVFFGAVRI